MKAFNYKRYLLLASPSLPAPAPAPSSTPSSLSPSYIHCASPWPRPTGASLGGVGGSFGGVGAIASYSAGGSASVPTIGQLIGAGLVASLWGCLTWLL